MATNAPKNPVGRPRGRPKSVKPAADGAAAPKKRGRKPGSRNTPKPKPDPPLLPFSARLRAAAKPGPVQQKLTLHLQLSPSLPERPMLVRLMLALPLPPVLNHTPLLAHDDSASDLSVFVEPAVAPLTPGFAGYALELMPPAKAKRPALAGGRGRKPKAPRSLPVPDEGAEQRAAEAEQQYRARLQTPKLEQLTALSEVRTPLQRKRGRPPKNKPPGTPQAPKKKSEGTPGRALKRLKIISPRKPSALLVRPVLELPDDSDSNTNDDFCTTCGGTGIFICCDSCPKSFHLLCCDPPLVEIPEDNWNCNECLAAQGLVPKPLHSSLGMFGRLVNATHGRNPAEFRLPKRLRDLTFVDVATGDDNAYKDALFKPDTAVSKLNAGQLAGFNRNDDLDVDALYDKRGKPYLCHKCRLLGLHRRTMVACDYCPLRWHLDCLPTAVALAKTLGLKWRCPNHVELLLPSFWLERRSFRDTMVLDAAAHSNFMRILLASNFLVKHEDQPYIKDSRTPALHDYLQYQKEDFLSNATDYVERWTGKHSQEPDSENDEDTVPNFKPPEYMQNYAVDSLVVARTPRRLGKVLLMTNADDPENKPFIYRVPEQQILLDFWQASKKKRILREIAQYESRLEAEMEKDDAAACALQELQEEKRRAPRSDGADMDELVAAAMLLSEDSVKQEPNGHGEDGHSEDGHGEDEIRQLMRAKGRKALLEFLRL